MVLHPTNPRFSLRRLQAEPLLIGLAVAMGLVLLADPAAATTWVYVQEGSPLTHHAGHQTPVAEWPSTSFVEDGSWTSSSTGFGIGYGDGDDNTVLGDMSGSYLTVYVRAHFSVGSELGSIQHMELETRFDDGFVAYLNGVEIARSHVPAGPLGADDAASSHEVTDGTETFVVDPGLLVQGDNVFAVEVHNSSLTSSDLSFIPLLFAYDTPPPDARITRGPFVQQVSRRGALLVWETDVPAPSTVVHGPTETFGLTAEDPTPKTHHVIALDDLRPHSWHHYQVQSARTPSVAARFHTEVDRAEPFRVAVYGDTRTGHAEHAAVVAELVPHEPMLAFQSGDLVSDGDMPGHWDSFFRIEAPFIRDVALYPALGNHEGSGSLYLDIFELPADSPSPERYFAVRYATALGIVLDQYGNAYGAGSEQYDWLEQTLQAAAQDSQVRHRWVFFHHGPYDSGSHGSNLTVRNDLTPLFEQYGVDLVMSGHDHDYERGEVNGVQYVVTGGGGAPLYALSGDWWTQAFESVHHYCLLDVHGPRLEFTAYRLDGSVLDSFILGEDGTECAQPADCDAMEAPGCEPDETGEWQCVYGACIYNCFVEPVEPPDGGVGGGGVGGGGSGAFAGSGPAGPALSEDDSGCGCRLVGPVGGALGWLGLVGAWSLLVWRRRRSGR